jgi:hypothetical protein
VQQVIDTARQVTGRVIQAIDGLRVGEGDPARLVADLAGLARGRRSWHGSPGMPNSGRSSSTPATSRSVSGGPDAHRLHLAAAAAPPGCISGC